jgi:hypothetical protein
VPLRDKLSPINSKVKVKRWEAHVRITSVVSHVAVSHTCPLCARSMVAIGIVLFVVAHWMFWSLFEAGNDDDVPVR